MWEGGCVRVFDNSTVIVHVLDVVTVTDLPADTGARGEFGMRTPHWLRLVCNLNVCFFTRLKLPIFFYMQLKVFFKSVKLSRVFLKKKKKYKQRFVDMQSEKCNTKARFFILSYQYVSNIFFSYSGIRKHHFILPFTLYFFDSCGIFSSTLSFINFHKSKLIPTRIWLILYFIKNSWWSSLCVEKLDSACFKIYAISSQNWKLSFLMISNTVLSFRQ